MFTTCYCMYCIKKYENQPVSYIFKKNYVLNVFKIPCNERNGFSVHSK